MTGINRYEEILNSVGMESLNEAVLDELLHDKYSIPEPTRPCIFLSHKSEDKKAVIKIGEYIKKQGIDIYLDINDKSLQDAVKNDDHKAITKAIEIGIHASTDLMSIISDETAYSWWVPYEIGFAKSREKYLSTLKLKNITYIPSFLQIITVLNNQAEFNSYLNNVKKRVIFGDNLLENDGVETENLNFYIDRY